MMSKIDAWVATAAKQKLVRQQIDLGPLGDEDSANGNSMLTTS
jgi:uncharacterized zinc-type alcohol dehydrogenase-like protein